MDAEGHKAIAYACADAHITVAVTPRPEEGENVRFVHVETVDHVNPALSL
ncbi:MAG TPA: hypothetical protein VF401_01425 [Candidatus Saccharimonadales bacterium]